LALPMRLQPVTIKDYRFFVEAWLLLAYSRLLLLFRPFNKILPVLKNDVAPNKDAEIALLMQIQLAIARAAKKSPWRTKCFEQALAGRMMLKRRGFATTTYFGVLKNSDSLEAHAWLKCGEFVVTGWKKINDYTIVGAF
jgi:hypothetical protein